MRFVNFDNTCQHAYFDKTKSFFKTFIKGDSIM